MKSVSAFANGFGGTLIWGITNDDEVVGLENAESDAEFISETIKTKIDSIPKVNLRFHMEDNKKLILLDVYAGKETPYLQMQGHCWRMSLPFVIREFFVRDGMVWTRHQA